MGPNRPMMPNPQAGAPEQQIEENTPAFAKDANRPSGSPLMGQPTSIFEGIIQHTQNIQNPVARTAARVGAIMGASLAGPRGIEAAEESAQQGRLAQQKLTQDQQKDQSEVTYEKDDNGNLWALPKFGGTPTMVQFPAQSAPMGAGPAQPMGPGQAPSFGGPKDAAKALYEKSVSRDANGQPTVDQATWQAQQDEKAKQSVTNASVGGGAQQINTQIANALKGTGVDPSAYTVGPDDSATDAKAKLKAAQDEAAYVQKSKAPVSMMVGGSPAQVLWDAAGRQYTTLDGKPIPASSVKPMPSYAAVIGGITAQKNADTLDQNYLGVVRQADNIRDGIKSAKDFDALSASLLPLEGALFVTTANGVKRINMTEVEGLAHAGSLANQVEGWINKAKAGDPVPDDIKQDYLTLVDQYQKNAYKTYQQGLQGAFNRAGGQQGALSYDGTFGNTPNTETKGGFFGEGTIPTH
jgi:hypothetical protein